MREAEAEGKRLEAEAAKQLAVAEKEFNSWLDIGSKAGDLAIKRSPPGLSFNDGLEVGLRPLKQLAPQIDASNAKVKAAKRAVADPANAATKLIVDAKREREQSQQKLLPSMIAVAVGTVVTAAAGWGWRRGATGGH
jgi:hypothetical protein